MAEESKKIEQVSDRGLFDFMGKKQEVVVNGVGYVHAESTEQTDENKDGGDMKSFLDKLHRPHSSDSGSSSDEEEIGTGGEKRRKKKGLKQKTAEKLSGDKMEGPEEEKIATVTVTELEEDQKKGIFEKIKEKVTGHRHKTSEQESKGCDHEMESDGSREKKGIFGKIMDKLPGYNKEELDSNTPPAAGH